MKEIEVKILEANVPQLVSKLKKMGAKKTFEGEIEGGKYDFSDHRLDKKGILLRLRKRGKNVELTLKKGFSTKVAKIADEWEVSVSSFELMKKILNEVGLRSNASTKKHRLSYAWKKIHFDFDTPPGIPTFMEIEAPDVETLKKMVKQLGFSMKQTKTWGGKELHAYYEKRHKK